MAHTAERDGVQIIAYLRRNRSLSREQFYDYWENVHAAKVIPWAEKHGIRRYQQVHAAGKIAPSTTTESAPDLSEPRIEPIEFDGIAMMLIPSMDRFADAFKDPYYTNVIEPDERMILDKEGPGRGIVASWQGRMIDMVHLGQSAIGDKGKEYREQWEEFEKKARS